MCFSNVVENATLVNKLIRTFKETFPLQCQQHRVISTRRPGVRDGSRWVTTGMRWTGTGHEPATHRKCWEHQAETVPDLGHVCVTLDFKHKYWCRGRNFSVSLCFLSVRYTVSCLSDMACLSSRWISMGVLWEAAAWVSRHVEVPAVAQRPRVLSVVLLPGRSRAWLPQRQGQHVGHLPATVDRRSWCL